MEKRESENEKFLDCELQYVNGAEHIKMEYFIRKIIAAFILFVPTSFILSVIFGLNLVIIYKVFKYFCL